ncbi:MAG: rod shape-determining protein MreC, partial [Muribaculaceae bacterium]|nr:rod shape-determining protein MreC [Muribaculaceae bacterium]
MNNLLDFIVKHSHWLVFILYMVAGSYLLFHNSPYQQSVYLTSANVATAKVLEVYSNVTGYFHLRDINEDLHTRNALLEKEMINLREQINDYKLLLADTVALPEQLSHYDYIVAHVIGNSVSQTRNYVTINRGRAEGIEPDMGVIDQNGIVGKVELVGEHSSRVISMLHPDFHLSCKMKGSEFFGSVGWDGKNPQEASFNDLPRHLKYAPGDTVITSGFSDDFP